MRIVDKFGETVEKLEDLEPGCHFVEHDGVRSPIMAIEYGAAIPSGVSDSIPKGRLAYIKIEWDD